MKLNYKTIRLGLLGFGLTLALGGVYLQLKNQHQTQEPPAIRPVKVVAVRYRDESDAIQQTGEIQPRRETELSFQIGGKVIKRVVEVGDAVKAGMVLAALDDTDVSDELKSAEAELSGATSGENQATLANKRAAELLKISAISKAEAETTEAAYRAAVAKRESAQSLLETARRKKHYAQLTAREDGIVTAVSANVGQIVSPGQMILSIASLSEREAVFAVPETLIHQGSTDAPVEVSLVSNPEIKMLGKIREVSPNADPSTRTFRVRVSLPKAPEEMAIGVSVQGRAIIPARRSFHLPPSSLTSVEDQPAVYVVQTKTKTIERRSIEVSRFTNDFVSVTGGLMEGELVVTAGVSKLRPNQSVKLEKEASR